MANPQIRIQTGLGDMLVELYPAHAPITVENFLRYVDENRFEGATFYRVVHLENQPNNQVKIEVIQGGLKDEDHPQSLPNIAHETTTQTGILHRDGVISMARNEPGTASADFFICIGDQPELDFGGRRNPDGQGFAAFGKVIAGMDTARRIQALPEENQYLKTEIAFKIQRAQP